MCYGRNGTSLHKIDSQNKTIEKQQQQITMQFIQLSALQSTTKDQVTSNKERDNDVNFLYNRVEELKSRLEIQEQYSRRTSLPIFLSLQQSERVKTAQIQTTLETRIGYVDPKVVTIGRCGSNVMTLNSTAKTSRCVCRKDLAEIACLKVAFIDVCTDSECGIWIYFDDKLSITKPTMSVAQSTSTMTTTSKQQLTAFMTTQYKTTAVNKNNSNQLLILTTEMSSKSNKICTTLPAHGHVKSSARQETSTTRSNMIQNTTSFISSKPVINIKSDHVTVAYNVYGLSINKEQDYVHVGDTPRYSCTVQENANFLIGNPLKWEMVGSNGSNLVISVLTNVEEGLASEYMVQLDTGDNSMTFTLIFLQGIKKEYDGFFVCALYDKNGVVLAKTKVEVNVIAKTTTAVLTTVSSMINSTCHDGHVICSQLLPGECEAGIHLMILCPRSCGICTYTARYCDDRSNDCSKVTDQCKDSTVKQICPSSCNICDGHHCNSTMTYSALSNNSVLSHPAGDYCSDGTQTNADSVVLDLCNARIDKMWQKGIQVVSNCQKISLYAPVSSFGSFSHQIGIFLGCTDTGFKIGMQRCQEHFKEQTLVSGNTSTTFSNADVYFVLIVK
ncbi:unnamed protein product [Mytilus coruscus]|uniref:ShKT domain-containing protein n=1 Tax=Mytilus coruscus TaxID=42192 RepID=A0A6J8DW94_MYTCO|nr:unnamed protein product [Mytilus coruscus]